MSGADRWSRRDFVGGATLLALALGVPLATVRMTDLDAADIPTDGQRQMLWQVCDLVIPRTGTPGAAEVGVPDFVTLALAHGLEDSLAPISGGQFSSLARFLRRDRSLRYIPWLEAELDHRVGGNWVGRTARVRHDALAELDAQAYPPGPPPADPSPWRKIKALILTGYYTSQVGGSQELRFELVPGRFDSDLPARRSDPAWSSDWNAVDFG